VRLHVVLPHAFANVVHKSEVLLREGVSLFSTPTQRVGLPYLCLYRHTQHERGQHRGDGNELEVGLHASLPSRRCDVDAGPTVGWQGVQCG